MGFGRNNPATRRCAPTGRRVRRRLDPPGITTVVADYWISYALTFETDERVIATPIDNVRYWPYDERVRAAGATNYVLYRGSAGAVILEQSARQQGIQFRRENVSGYLLYRLDVPEKT